MLARDKHSSLLGRNFLKQTDPKLYDHIPYALYNITQFKMALCSRILCSYAVRPTTIGPTLYGPVHSIPVLWGLPYGPLP